MVNQSLGKMNVKILMLTWEFPPDIIGGLGRHAFGLSRELCALGFEIHLLTARRDTHPFYENVEGIHVYRVLPLNDGEEDFLLWVGGLNIALVDKAIELSFKHRFTVIHAHDWLVSAVAISLKNYFNIPLISTIHATEHGRNNGISTELQRFIHEKEQDLVERSDHVIVCSTAMKMEIYKIFLRPVQEISVIPNGVDETVLPLDKKDLLASLPLDHKRKLIFSLGRMVKEKGFDILIEAARKMKKRGMNVYFIIAGTGPLLSFYRNRVRDLSLHDTVYFIGFIDEYVRTLLFQECYLAVFPSRYEPFGIAALEAMIAERPVIAANRGGLRELIRHGRTGLLMDPDDPDSFIEQAVFLLENEATALCMGRLAKKHVKHVFSWRRTALLTKRVYEKVLVKGSDC